MAISEKAAPQELLTEIRKSFPQFTYYFRNGNGKLYNAAALLAMSMHAKEDYGKRRIGSLFLGLNSRGEPWGYFSKGDRRGTAMYGSAGDENAPSYIYKMFDEKMGAEEARRLYGGSGIKFWFTGDEARDKALETVGKDYSIKRLPKGGILFRDIEEHDDFCRMLRKHNIYPK